MDAPNPVVTNVCQACERLIEEASAAMRRHAAQMNRALQAVRSGHLTEEERQNFKATLLASFNEAESAWDTYREHLVEHGILPEQS